MQISRRGLLGAGGIAAAGVVTADRSSQAAQASPAVCAGLRRIKHIVILVQENRSFDQYFGSYKGVRGFDDRSAPGGANAFRQGFTPPAAPPGIPNPMLPWHVSTAVMVPPRQGECTNDVEHQWAGAHASWNKGANDAWMASHLATELDAKQAAITMSYYTRDDLAFYYALADTFTICDSYFSSVIGGTDQNRLMSLTGTLDPDCWDGGGTFANTKLALVNSPGADLGVGGRWVPYPQVLSGAGISWKVYGTPDGQDGDNVLRYFPQFRPGTGDLTLSANAFGSEAFPADFAADCAAGTLPEVSWLLPGVADSEHAPAPPEWGESITHTVLTALTTSPAWKDCALFITYDENGGFFDHVPPPVPPAGTAGEFFDQSAITAQCRKDMTTVKGVDLSAEPIGLGMRVPLLVVSPFTRNPDPSGAPLVCSETFDHTSLLRFIESWSFAVGRPAPIPDRDPSRRRPGLSAWRRSVVGDLTSAFSLAAAPDASVPANVLAVVPNRASPSVLTECTVTGTIGSESARTRPIVQDPDVPATLTQPTQERFTGPVRRPQAACSTIAAAGGPAPHHPARHRHRKPPAVQGAGGSLAATGAPAELTVLATAATVLGAALVRRRARETAAEDASAGR